MAKSQIISRFGASVRSLRHSLGMSQEALAERADLHRTYITGIECGARNVTLKCIDKLARALQVPPTRFFRTPAERARGRSHLAAQHPPENALISCWWKTILRI